MSENGVDIEELRRLVERVGNYEGHTPDWADAMATLRDIAPYLAHRVIAAENLVEALGGMLEYTADLNPLQGYDECDADAVKSARASLAEYEATK